MIWGDVMDKGTMDFENEVINKQRPDKKQRRFIEIHCDQ
jgi:hypothetical protein